MDSTAAPSLDLTELRRRGFALVPGLIPPETARAIAARLESGLLANSPCRRARGVRHVAARVPELRQLAASGPIARLVARALGGRGRLVRSVFFDKTAVSNWKVAWHQDLTIAVAQQRAADGYGPWSVKDGVVSVQPPVAVLARMITLRLHLDHCGADNGPLRVVAGSHRCGRLGPEAIPALVSDGEIVACSCGLGDALVMKPLLVHASAPAGLPGHRRILHFDYARGPLPGGVEWSPVA